MMVMTSMVRLTSQFSLALHQQAKATGKEMKTGQKLYISG
jgi:hypothetical protein